MNTVKIKPLSANKMWQGKRYKTPAYKNYEKALMCMLPRITKPSGLLSLQIEVGFSSTNSDVDNVLKPFIDILQKKYLFNDRDIYEISARKNIVKKGFEYISFKLDKLTPPKI